MGKKGKGRRGASVAGLDLAPHGEVLLALLLIAGGDGWLDPLGVEVSASAGGCGRRGWGVGSILRRRIRDLAVLIEWEMAAVVGGEDPREVGDRAGADFEGRAVGWRRSSGLGGWMGQDPYGRYIYIRWIMLGLPRSSDRNRTVEK